LAELALEEERRLQEEAEAAERERQRLIEVEKARVRAEEEKERRIVEVSLPNPAKNRANPLALSGLLLAAPQFAFFECTCARVPGLLTVAGCCRLAGQAVEGGERGLQDMVCGSRCHL